MKNKLNYTSRILKNGKTIDRCQTHSKRRFYNRIRMINWRNSPIKVYLRVSYGKKKCIKGCLCTFYNDGWYNNENNLMWAFNAFSEEN